MQVKLTNISDTKFKLTVTADGDFMTAIKNRVLKRLGSQTTKPPGFRPGKAPLNLVEKSLDANVLQQEFLEEAVNALYIRATSAEHLRPVSQPEVAIQKFVPFDVLEFTVQVEAVGKITLPDYKKIKVARAEVKVTAAEVNEVIDGLKQRQAERTAKKGPAANGDELTVDFKGTDSQGEAIKGTDGQDVPLVIGSNAFIPGFEPNLIGLSQGQDKTFVVTFPKDYGVKTLQGKNVTFWVKVKTVSQLKEPKLDDKFAAAAGPFKTLNELKEDIRMRLTAERQQQDDKNYERQLLDEIVAGSKIAVPEALINEQLDQAEQQERQNLAYRGQTWQEHLAEEGVTEQEHRVRHRADAERAVKSGLVLGEISEREQIVVTPEELEIRLQLLKGQYKDAAMQTELDKPENRQDIANRLLTEKTLALLTGKTQA